jgi:hypothetical protein
MASIPMTADILRFFGHVKQSAVAHCDCHAKLSLKGQAVYRAIDATYKAGSASDIQDVDTVLAPKWDGSVRTYQVPHDCRTINHSG